MIIQSLVSYYETLEKRGEISNPGWCKLPVDFVLDISLTGELLNVIPLSEDVLYGKKTVKRPRMCEVPERVVRSSNVRTYFLCDNSTYILGLDKKGNPEYTRKRFDACKKEHIAFLGKIENPVAQAVLKYFENWQQDSANENIVLKPYKDKLLNGNGSEKVINIVFLVNKVFLHEDPEVKRAWSNVYATKNKVISTENPDPNINITKTKDVTGRCLVTGEVTPIARIHQSIKKIQGAKSCGASLVSFNCDSFKFGEKKQGANAPISKHAVFAYTTALNALIENGIKYVGDTALIYWAETAEPQYNDCLSMLMDPKEDDNEKLSGIMKHIAKGDFLDEGIQPEVPFYVLGLAPNSSRLSVKFFLSDTFGNILLNLKKHHERLEIVKPKYENKKYLSLSELLDEITDKKTNRKLRNNLAGSILKSILLGTPYPSSLLSETILRISDTPNVSWKKAAIIKACLLQNNYEKYKEVLSVSLNEETDSIPYVLGRLFAVLEKIQQDTKSGINTTIKDRYFHSACTNPNAAFPVLLKLSNHHLRKLSEGSKIHHNKSIVALLGKLDIASSSPFPKHFSFQEQGTFILGYYHQTQVLYS